MRQARRDGSYPTVALISGMLERRSPPTSGVDMLLDELLGACLEGTLILQLVSCWDDLAQEENSQCPTPTRSSGSPLVASYTS